MIYLLLWILPFVNTNDVTKIKVSSAGLYTTYMVSVDCDGLLSSFFHYDNFTVTNEDVTRNILRRIKDAIPSRDDHMDARVKLYLYHQNNSIDTLCLNAFNDIFYKGKYYTCQDSYIDRYIDSMDNVNVEQFR